MKEYRVEHDVCEGYVFDNGKLRELEPRYDLINHSPDGFSWGYVGSGPSQLSLAILADHLDDDARALELYNRFMHEVVSSSSRFPMEENFAMPSEVVVVWLAR